MTNPKVSAINLSLKSPASAYQHIILPRPGRKFVFDVTPGASYATGGEEYTAHWSDDAYFRAGEVRLRSVERGSECYDRISAWEYAKWRYV